MPRLKPTVMDGTRGPRADHIDEIRARAAEEPDIAQGLTAVPKVDGTVYLSPFPSYCVQVTAPADLTDPITGRKTIGRPIKALFQEGRYVNNAKDPKVRAHIDEVLQSNSRFGLPGSGADYWLAAAAIRMTKAAAKASAMRTLRELAKQNPGELSRVLSELQQGDAADVTMPAPPRAPVAEA